MRTTLLAILATLAVVVLFGCAQPPYLMPAPDVLVAQGIVEQGADLETLQRGRMLAATECVGCHRLYWPQERAPDEWPPVLREMGRRTSLGERDIEAIVRYYTAAARAAEAQRATGAR